MTQREPCVGSHRSTDGGRESKVTLCVCVCVFPLGRGVRVCVCVRASSGEAVPRVRGQSAPLGSEAGAAHTDSPPGQPHAVHRSQVTHGNPRQHTELAPVTHTHTHTHTHAHTWLTSTGTYWTPTILFSWSLRPYPAIRDKERGEKQPHLRMYLVIMKNLLGPYIYIYIYIYINIHLLILCLFIWFSYSYILTISIIIKIRIIIHMEQN